MQPTIVGAIVAPVAWLLVSLLAHVAPNSASGQQRLFGCESTFLATDDAKTLALRFGDAAVAKADIYLGEGFSEAGSVLFGDSSEDRVEILWSDVVGQRSPKSIRIRGQRSHWRTRMGISLGDDLRLLERLNRRPFRLAGFGWDYSGTELSWSGGRLEAADSAPCVVRARLAPEGAVEDQGWYRYRQVMGDREFSSGHPAMQYLNPRVYEVWLDFKKAS